MLATIFLFVLLLGGISVLCVVYGNPEGAGLMNRLCRLFTRIYSREVYEPIERIFGKRVVSRIISVAEYVFIKKNPLVLILYLVLTVGGYLLFIVHAYPHLPNSVAVYPYHKQFAFGIVLSTFFLFLRAATVDPGIISRMNHKAHMKIFPYDGEIFTPNQRCSTCKFDKPARSKHCSVCDVCVGRFDHHCVWINQCIGAGNEKFFLLFLIANNIMCFYGGYLGIAILLDQVEVLNLRNTIFRNIHTGERYPPTNAYICMYLLGAERVLMFLTLFCSGIALFLLGFTWHHWVTLMKHGITTNEQYKLKHVPLKTKTHFITTYSRGSLLGNIRAVLRLTCPPIDSS